MFPCNDKGNAKRLVRKYGKNLRYCRPVASWFIWDGRRWLQDEIGAVMDYAKVVTDSIYHEAADAKGGDGDELWEWAKRSGSYRGLEDMLRTAQTEPGIKILPGQLDADPELLNCLNGTIDLRTGKLRPHRREDLLTQLAPVNYEPGATCPHWMKFLERVIPNAELRDYTQRVVGYCLTGNVDERCMFIWHGTGRNGKSTLLDAIQTIFGDYAITAAASTLMTKREQGTPTGDLARLKGRRMVCTSESGSFASFSEEIVKSLTGGKDKIVCRFIYGREFEYLPTFKILFATNHRPTIRGTDDGMWDRLHCIPMTERIGDDEIIPGSSLSKQFQTEAAGIFQWALEGLAKYRERGLKPPATVTAATKEYRTEQDQIGQFIEACCTEGETCRESAANLYARYKTWCDAAGERARSQTLFGRDLNTRPYDRVNNKGTWYIGIEIRRD
jgi:putative DNA primase/helicase